MTDRLRTPTTADRVAVALLTAAPAVRTSATARSAIMLAEAIEDDDLGDGLFRFGPRLRTALEALGLAQVALALLLPRPVVGRLQAVDPQRHLAAVDSGDGSSLAA